MIAPEKESYRTVPDFLVHKQRRSTVFDNTPLAEKVVRHWKSRRSVRVVDQCSFNSTEFCRI
jgi:hypothetical protein